MRTPQKTRNGGRQAANGSKKDLNKLRKRAMKSKMMKKTMFTLAGDDTKVCTYSKLEICLIKTDTGQSLTELLLTISAI